MARHLPGPGARGSFIFPPITFTTVPLPGSRRETDPANPASVYACTKREGERAVLAADGANIVARTAWIFGPDRPQFADQIITRAKKEPNCAAIGETFSSASYSLDMAPASWNTSCPADVAGGIYNLSNTGSASWLGNGPVRPRCPDRTRLETALPAPCKASALADMPSFIASRPVHTVMDLTKIAAVTGKHPPPLA